VIYHGPLKLGRRRSERAYERRREGVQIGTVTVIMDGRGKKESYYSATILDQTVSGNVPYAEGEHGPGFSSDVK